MKASTNLKLLLATIASALTACGMYPTLSSDSSSTSTKTSTSTKAKMGWKPAADGSINIAVLGDSLAAGLLADTYAGQPYSLDRTHAFMGAYVAVMANPLRSQQQRWQDFDAGYANPGVSALSGTASYSLATKLQDRFPKAQVQNVRRCAVSATRVGTLGPQIDAMKDDYDTKKITPADIVVVHVGSNDWCDRISKSQFEKSLKTQLNELMSVNPKAQILLLPISDLVSVLSVADKQLPTSTVLGEKPYSCEQIRERTQTCMKRGIKMGASEEDVAADRQSLDEYNQIIQKVVAQVRKEATSFKGKVMVGTSYAQRVKFEWDWLALDCFHPGINGQELIGKRAWKDLETLLK